MCHPTQTSNPSFAPPHKRGSQHIIQLNSNISLTNVKHSQGCSSYHYKHTFLFLPLCKPRMVDVTLIHSWTQVADERGAVPVFPTRFNLWHKIHLPSVYHLKGKVMLVTFNIFLVLFFLPKVTAEG